VRNSPIFVSEAASFKYHKITSYALYSFVRKSYFDISGRFVDLLAVNFDSPWSPSCFQQFIRMVLCPCCRKGSITYHRISCWILLNVCEWQSLKWRWTQKLHTLRFWGVKNYSWWRLDENSAKVVCVKNKWSNSCDLRMADVGEWNACSILVPPVNSNVYRVVRAFFFVMKSSLSWMMPCVNMEVFK
jgi:hypothetical protein